MAAQWKYTVSKNGRHQISEVGKSQVCMMWNSSDRKERAELIAKAPQMEEYLIELHERFAKAGFINEAARIMAILEGK